MPARKCAAKPESLPRQSKRASARSAKSGKNRTPGTLDHDVESVVAALKRLATKRTLDGMARYAIPSDKAFGVAVGDIQKLGKRIGRNHELALALWETGWYEARMLAAFVGEPERVTPGQMDRWCRDFDNWAICDTICFHLFDRTPHAWQKVTEWAERKEEFVRRAAFALLACLALHDKRAESKQFLPCFPLIEAAAQDERNFVKKSVSWALRSLGRRTAPLHSPAVALARRLAASPDQTARWIGKDALRDLAKPAVMRRLAGTR
jgi:3-methyladenine DNA glycosylase AlkD